ncbi:MAG: ACT domain-containing protein [bacterium]
MFQKSIQLAVFLENKPGELSRLARVLGEKGINIASMSIQDPTEYIQGLFRAREVTTRRIASTASYGAILKEASLLTLIRFITSEPGPSVEALTQAGYTVNTEDVILAVLDNRPGQLASICERLAKENINIDYTYGSALEEVEKALFVFRVSNTDLALKVLSGTGSGKRSR